MLDRIINLTRQLDLRGKGRLYHKLTPWSGERFARISRAYSMELNLHDGQQRQIYMGCFNIQVQRAIRAALSTGGTFLDVGANEGFFRLLAAEIVGDTGRVVSVEPFPGTFSRLTRNVELNKVKHIDLQNIALSEHDGTLILFSPPKAEDRAFNVSIVGSPGAEEVTVPCRTLDSVFSSGNIPQMDLVKLDVEGAEEAVLQGGRSFFLNGRAKFLICEINTNYLRQLGSSPKQLVDLILSLGFVHAQQKFGTIRVASEEPKLPVKGDPDLLFIHRSRVA